MVYVVKNFELQDGVTDLSDPHLRFKWVFDIVGDFFVEARMKVTNVDDARSGLFFFFYCDPVDGRTHDGMALGWALTLYTTETLYGMVIQNQMLLHIGESKNTWRLTRTHYKSIVGRKFGLKN